MMRTHHPTCTCNDADKHAHGRGEESKWVAVRVVKRVAGIQVLHRLCHNWTTRIAIWHHRRESWIERGCVGSKTAVSRGARVLEGWAVEYTAQARNPMLPGTPFALLHTAQGGRRASARSVKRMHSVTRHETTYCPNTTSSPYKRCSRRGLCDARNSVEGMETFRVVE